MNILVLHGPNLNLLGERPGDEKGRPLEELNGLIRARALALGIAVKAFQSNHEGALLDTLHSERRWADGIIINPAALTHTSYVLREALAAVAKPVIEVHLTDIRRRESWRRKSVIKDVCESQVLGKGFESYLIALERFASGDLAGRKRVSKKTLGPAPKLAPVAAPAPTRPVKTLGRRAPEPRPEAPTLPPPPKQLVNRTEVSSKTVGRAQARTVAVDTLTRALVRQKIAERLSGKLTPAGLSTWARTRWLDVQRGAPAESGQREVLEDSLQSLVLSTMPASRMSEDQLIDLMTQLEG